jgi:hypothetical protein
MRSRPDALLITALAVFAVTGLAGTALMYREPPVIDPVPMFVGGDPAPLPGGVQTGTESGAQWFAGIRGFCNPVDVETRLRWQPAPESEDGIMHEAACYALAGKVELARASVLRLPTDRRYHAAGIIFNAGHPAADAGDDLAAGPLMELVVEFWPNHYMALYHAGAAAHERGDRLVARGYLERFLAEYATEDGWRSSALEMLEADRR